MFSAIEIFELQLSTTDIASDKIENIINVNSTLFNNLIEFILVDESKYRGTFGVFLGFYKKLKNIKKLTFQTQDRNVNVILGECLPYMINLEDICLTSTAGKIKERFEIIRTLDPKLIKLTVAEKFVRKAEEFFGPRIEIVKI